MWTIAWGQREYKSLNKIEEVCPDDVQQHANEPVIMYLLLYLLPTSYQYCHVKIFVVLY